ncbi:MAG: crotonase/enoyl-CoA hydratase family protein [Xanthobacteraceae bacterium]
MSKESPARLPKLPASLHAELRGELLVVRLNRPEKRNALNDDTIHGLETLFDALPKDVKAVVLHGDGEHFSAGLDLSELRQNNIEDAVRHSSSWHRIFHKMEFGNVPIVAALHGAVVGGGLELAATAHVRIAERSTFYALPEGVRGIFVGGGGSVRIPRLIGASRMMEMMLTGHVLSAEEGQTLGLSHYIVEPGAGLAKALELAGKIAQNAWLTNFGVIQALPRIAEQDPASGYVMEALMAAIAGGGEEAKARVKAFLEKRVPKVSAK